MSQSPPEPVIGDLVDEHGRMVHATAYRILGNVEDAKDVYQDVFLKVLRLRRWGRLQKVQDWGAYLRVMASRRALDVARRNRTRKQVLSVDWIDELDRPGDDNPRYAAVREERARLMREGVAALPKREALALSLHYFDDLPLADIGTHLDLSPNAVGVLLYRARRRLHGLLRPVLGQDTPSTNLAVVSAVAGDPS